MLNNTEPLLALALFQADPRSQECREMLHQSIVEFALLTSETAMTEAEIGDKITEILKQPTGIPKEECNKALQICVSENSIKKKSNGYVLKQERREALGQQHKACLEDEREFEDRLVEAVEKEIGFTLDDIAKTLLYSSVKTVIQKMFYEKSIELKKLMAEKKCDYKSLLTAGSGYNALESLDREIKPMVRTYALNKQEEVINGIKLFFTDVNEASTRYLISLHHRVFYFQLLNIDPDVLALQKRCFENTRLYLDTNVVMALFFEAHPLNTVVRDIVNACESLNINLLVSASTYDELQNQISHAKSLVTVTGEKKAASLIVDTAEGRGTEPILATFLLKKKKEPNLNWGGFIGRYEDLETYLLYSNVILDTENSKGVRTHEHYNRVWQTIRTVRSPVISDSVIDHDADNFILIHNLRQKYVDNPLFGPSVWLLTLDHSLKIDEAKLTSVFNTEHCRLIEEWGELLLPFQNINQFVFSNYITYLIASELGVLLRIPALDFNILNIISNPELELGEFYDLPTELQIKVLSGMQKEKSIHGLQERANKAVTPEEKAAISDEFKAKELEILVEEKEQAEEKVNQLSNEVSQLQKDLVNVSKEAGQKDNAVLELSARVQKAEERLTNYEDMSFWDWLKKYLRRK